MHLQDMDQLDGFMMGKTIWRDRKFEGKSSPPKGTMAISCKGDLMRQKKKQPWHVHQSLAWTNWGRCCWARFPGIEKVRQKLNALMTPLCTARNAAQHQDATFIYVIAIRVAKWCVVVLLTIHPIITRHSYWTNVWEDDAGECFGVIDNNKLI
jgi:hypothetical protein